MNRGPDTGNFWLEMWWLFIWYAQVDIFKLNIYKILSDILIMTVYTTNMILRNVGHMSSVFLIVVHDSGRITSGTYRNRISNFKRSDMFALNWSCLCKYSVMQIWEIDTWIAGKFKK